MNGTMTADLSQLKNPELEKNIASLGDQVHHVNSFLSLACSAEAEEAYSKLDAAGKAQIDLFKTYAINSLFRFYLKTKGRDAANHAVKNELGRVKEHMDRAKQLKDRALAPRLNPGVAKRFVRGGLWQPKDKPEQQQDGSPGPHFQSQARHGKRKFQD